jgi:predicted metalloprotease with PDZ domain
MLRYRLDLGAPRSHTVDVTLEIAGASELGDQVFLEMAAWSPGSYLVRDYARWVRDVTATVTVASGAGERLAIAKTAKQRWAIERGGADSITVRYRVYGYELSVRTNHVDDRHAFLHGPSTFIYVDGLAGRPIEVELAHLPEGWQVHSGLEPTGDPKLWRAADLDALLDGPIHAGRVETRAIRAAGVDMELAVWGPREPSERDLDRLAGDLSAIVDAHAERLDGLPLDRYTFLLMLAPRSYGGLEHSFFSANLASSLAFGRDNPYMDVLELLSHEFFHIWNGKRIYPAALHPFDYRRESYTRCLWVVEGLTSFFDRYTVLRTGRMPPARYLEKLAEEWAKLVAIPGRAVHSLEDSSFDAWIKLYKPDPFNTNSTVSYYLKGGLVATALDLYIRRHSDGEKSLADVLRVLWARYGAEGRGYPEDVRPIFEDAVGLDLSEPFERWIAGTEDPDLAGELAHLGVGLAPDESVDDRRSYLGVQTADGPLRIRAIHDDSPAHLAGFAPGDQLIAIDRLRVSTDADLRRRLARREPGAEVELAFFRRNELRSIRVILAPTPVVRWRIATATHPTEDEKGRFSDWLGADWPEIPLVVVAGGKGWT